MMTHSVTEVRVTGTKKCPTLTNSRAWIILLTQDQCPERYPRKRTWVMSRWGLVTMKKLGSLKSTGSLKSP